jgi:hypothetical protein
MASKSTTPALAFKMRYVMILPTLVPSNPLKEATATAGYYIPRSAIVPGVSTCGCRYMPWCHYVGDRVISFSPAHIS